MAVEGFAAVPNWLLRDESVSGLALAVYTALASHTGPGGIHPSQATIARESRLSESSVRRALVELEGLGVVERVRRKSEVGRATNGYVLHPHGRLGADEVPVTVTATPEVTVTVTGGSGQGVQSRPLIEEEPIKKNPAIVFDAFDDFWSVYPRHVAKAAARKAFAKAVKSAGADAVMAGARRFAADPNLPEAQFVPHPSTWLNQGRWEDDPLPARESGSAWSAPEGQEWLAR